jgi:phosphate:Na+ symporter
VFVENNAALCEAIQKENDKLDLLNAAVKTYLVRLSGQALTRDESRREVALLDFCNELKTIGDIVERDLMGLAKKKMEMRVEFSKEGGAELEKMAQIVLESFQIAIAAFTGRDRTLAEQLARRQREVDECERNFRNSHFQRLGAGLQESIETSALHLDILTYLKAIQAHLSTVARLVLESGAN